MRAVNLYRNLVMILVAGLAARPAAAVEIEPEVVYPPGTRLEASALGVALTVPKGWQGVLPARSDVLMLQPTADPGAYLFVMGEPATQAEVRAQMAAPIELGNGITLLPRGELASRGRSLVGRYDVRGAGSPLAGYGEALAGDHGITVAYLLVAAPESLGSHEPTVHAIADSTVMAAPTRDEPAGGTQSGDGSGDRWDDYLKGKYIVRYYTSTGYTDEQHLWLCSDGTFHRKGASGGFGGGAGGAFQSNAAGRWTAEGAGANGTLTLQFADGSRAGHELFWDYEENKLYLDGKRWLHDENTVCN